MPEYKNGTPSWVDIGSPDMDASVAFYGGLFGWTATDSGPALETGGYRMFLKDGKTVAGLGHAEQEQIYWTTYFHADDADATAGKAKDAGGSVVVDPMDVMTAGRMAIIADSAGAVFGVWQPGEHKGAEVKGEAGSLVWAELLTRDVAGAKAFYGAVFGLGSEAFNPAGEGPDYTILNAGEDGVAGILDATAPEFPEDLPSHWLVYFAVDDVDASVETLKSLGGQLAQDPMDIPTVGRVAPVLGPHGEPFVLMKPDPSPG